MIRMIVFDMAGTTVDENNVVYKTLQEAINEAGFSVTLEEVLLEGAGKEKYKALKSILSRYTKNQDEKITDNIYQQFVKLLARAYDMLEIRPQANTVELFQALKKRNILVVLNTGYNSETAELIISKLEWRMGVEFDGLFTATDVANSRPHPDMILLAMKKFDIPSASEVIKVGDSIIDIEEGKNAGCFLNIGITTGAHTREQLTTAGPDYIINNLLELLPMIDNS